MSCTNCQELPGGSTVVLSEPQQPFCEQCADENNLCAEKLDAACLIYHLDGTKPNKLGNLGMGNGKSAEQIFEAINDLLGGGGTSVPLSVINSDTLSLFATGVGGHTLWGEVIVSSDTGNIIESRATGLYVSNTASGKVKINADDSADYLINQLVGGTDTIVSTSIIEDTGMLKIQPSLDIQCLLDKIRTDYLTEFCQIVSLCISNLPVVSIDCGSVLITSSFDEGVADTGSASIPVTVSGSGTVNVYASGAGFYGSQNVAIDGTTTSINLTFNYDGSSPAGTRNITFIIAGVQGGSVSCATTVDVNCDCDAVTNIIISSIDADSANISWTGTTPTPSLGYRVNVKKSSDNSLVFTGTTVGTNITATGLTADTQYYVEVVSRCSETCEETAGGVGTNFTTVSSCEDPISSSVVHNGNPNIITDSQVGTIDTVGNTVEFLDVAISTGSLGAGDPIDGLRFARITQVGGSQPTLPHTPPTSRIRYTTNGIDVQLIPGASLRLVTPAGGGTYDIEIDSSLALPLDFLDFVDWSLTYQYCELT